MNEQQQHEFGEMLSRLPIDDQPAPEHQARLKQQVLAEFQRAAPDLGANVALRRAGTSLWKQGIEVMERRIPLLIAASAAAVVAAVWIVGPGVRGSVAFAELIEPIMNARTARFDTTVAIEGQPARSMKSYYRAPGAFRQEWKGVTTISDGRQTLTLIEADKRAMLWTVVNSDRAKTGEDFFADLQKSLRDLQGKPGLEQQRLPERDIDGVKAVGIRTSDGRQTLSVWGDPKTNEPLLIEGTWAGAPQQVVTMSNFEFNVELDDQLFSMEIPEGYRVQRMDIDGSPPTEQDFIAALRRFAEMSGGTYPDGFDPATLSQSITRAVSASGRFKAGEKPSAEAIQKLMQDSAMMGRAFSFVTSQKAETDAHYAGKGVSKDTADRPIFWYKPKGSDKYRVLYADLSVKASDKAPEVEGAVKLPAGTPATDGNGAP